MKPIVQAMAKYEAFALATVIERNGSAPRSAGAKMLVRTDGSIAGTVGGGMLEAQVRQLALQMISEQHAVIRKFAFNGNDAASMDSICGGQVEVLVEGTDARKPVTAAVIAALQEALAQHRKAWLVTVFSPEASSTGHALVLPDGSTTGILAPGLTLETVLETRQLARIKTGGREVIIEPINAAGTAYIFGAGHVSRSLAEFTKAVGFWTVVIDDRAEYPTVERFPTADERIVLPSFANALQNLPVERDSFVVIVTRGHLNDQVVLEQALRTPAGYIGMIGSKRKCALIFNALRQAGFSEDDLGRVHAPIGLPIQAETPEEIGVSIVAEMIQARAKLIAEERGKTEEA